MKANNDSSLVINGFTVIQAKANESCKESHCLYLKSHSSHLKSNDWPSGKTLQVHNVPPYCNEENLKLLFSCCGKIANVYLQDKVTSVPEVKSPAESLIQRTPKKSYKVAYVVFKHLNSLKTACALDYNEIRLFSNEEVPLCNVGVAAYIKEYEESIVDLAALEKGANDFLTEYYKKKEEKDEEEKAIEGVPDSDGFIKVTRVGKNKGAKRTERTDRRGRERHRQRRRKNELTDFYKFQFRESKRQHLAQIQTKFEEDKKRVQEMKAARKFKPMG